MSLARLSGLVGILMLPLLASAQGTGCWLREAAAPTPTTIYVLCEQGTVHISTDAGATWTARDTGLQEAMAARGSLRSIAALDATHALIVGDKGLILATDDGGKTWTERLNAKGERFTKERILKITVLGTNLWASGFSGMILHSTDGGRSWEQQKSGTTMGLEDIFFLDPNHGWAVGWSGAILRTENGGQKWESVPSKEGTWSLTTVYFRDLNNGWAAGFSGQLLRSTDGGKTWTKQDSTVKAWLADVEFDSLNRAWITTDDGLLVSQDGGNKWQSVKLDKAIFPRRFVPVGKSLWAVGQLGLIQQGNGLEWQPIASLEPKSAAQIAAAAKSATK